MVFQHIVDPAYVANLVDKLVQAQSFVALVSLSITTSPPRAMRCLVDEHHWNSVFTELDKVSFREFVHEVRVLCRPTQWRLTLRDGAMGIEANGQAWRAVTINHQPAPVSTGWRPVELLSDLAPILLLVFEKGGQRAMWFIDENGQFIGNKVSDLPPRINETVRQGLHRILGAMLFRQFRAVGAEGYAELLALALPAPGR